MVGMTKLLASGISIKHLGSLILQYLDIDEAPLMPVTKKENLISSAWSTTGRHLRKALSDYGARQQTDAQQQK